MGEFALVLILAAYGLGSIPPEPVLLGLAVLLTAFHTLLEEPFGEDLPFWDYYRVYFGRGPALPFAVGFLAFAGLWAVLVTLAVLGFRYEYADATGALVGAMTADALVSHVLLQVIVPGRNPGLATASLYVLFVIAATALGVPMSAAGVAVGAGAFVGFWVLSFVFKRRS